MENLINQVKQFILQPIKAWEEVKNDETSAQQHIVSYVFPLSLIPAISIFIGYGIIGYSVMGIRVHSFGGGLSQALISIVTTILSVLISGFIIHKLAPSFQTQVSLDKAIMLVGFSSTAGLVGGIFNIFPVLSILVLVAGLYSLYTLYIGFKPMTNVSEEKSMGYFIVSLLVIIGAFVIINLVLTSVSGSFGMNLLR